MSNDPHAVCIMGPTASGKTDLAVSMVERGNYEIISVDSALVYKDMDIGTAKPDAEILAKAPHRLINLVDPSENYSVAGFRHDCIQAMEEIHANGNTPLLVGGTMMYFRALEFGLSELPAANPQIRQRLMDEAEASGWDILHQRLQQVDPTAATRIHPNDPQRIQRALEVYEMTGTPLSELQQRDKTVKLPWRLTKIARAPKDRSVLHQRIAKRFKQMMIAGFEDEVRQLFRRDELSPEMPSMRCVGYRQMWDYFEGELDYDEMVERAIIATRQLAKRQFTWLRSEHNLHWIWDDEKDIIGAAERLIKAAP